MPITRPQAVEIADRFVRERNWTNGWSTERLTVREVDHVELGKRCWVVISHGGRGVPPNETFVLVDMADGSVRRAVKMQGLHPPLTYESD